jgi:hypothetical protein
MGGKCVTGPRETAGSMTMARTRASARSHANRYNLDHIDEPPDYNKAGLRVVDSRLSDGGVLDHNQQVAPAAEAADEHFL